MICFKFNLCSNSACKGTAFFWYTQVFCKNFCILSTFWAFPPPSPHYNRELRKLRKLRNFFSPYSAIKYIYNIIILYIIILWPYTLLTSHNFEQLRLLQQLETIKTPHFVISTLHNTSFLHFFAQKFGKTRKFDVSLHCLLRRHRFSAKIPLGHPWVDHETALRRAP